MSFRLEDLDLVLGNAGILTAEQYQQVRGLLERALVEGNASAAAAATAATPSSSLLSSPLSSPALVTSSSPSSATADTESVREQGPSDDEEMGEATAEADGQEQEEEEDDDDDDVAMEGAADNVASSTAASSAAPVATAMVTTVASAAGPAPAFPLLPAAAAANAVPAVLPAVRTNVPIQTRFVGVANILTADIVLPPRLVLGVNFTPIARAATQPPAAITDDAIAQKFCRMWSLQFTARDTRRRSQQAGMICRGHQAEMDGIAAATYAVLFQQTGGPSRIHGWRQMTDLVTNTGYEILKILYDHRHLLAPGEFHAHVIALELVNSRNSNKREQGVRVRDMFTAAGF